MLKITFPYINSLSDEYSGYKCLLQMTYNVLCVITNDYCCKNVSQILCYLCKRVWNRWNVSFLFQAYQWSITVRFCRIHTLPIKNLLSFVQLYISRHISYFMLICIVNSELISVQLYLGVPNHTLELTIWTSVIALFFTSIDFSLKNFLKEENSQLTLF